MNSSLADYLKKGNKKVEGWLSEIAAEIIVKLSGLQEDLNIEGPVCEIGVHHGKLFILLHLITKGNEKSVAWDLFENQEENRDQSGCGDKLILQNNLLKNGGDLSKIKLISENSLNLSSEKVINECEGKPKLFSVDGGHTAEITFNDIKLAYSAICEGGIIIIDDFFNESWPGVAEGTCRFILENKPEIYPIIISGNKIFFTNRKNIAQNYQNHLSEKIKGCYKKESIFFGKKVLIFIPHRSTLRSFMVDSQLWEKIKNNKTGNFLRKLFRN